LRGERERKRGREGGREGGRERRKIFIFGTHETVILLKQNE